MKALVGAFNQEKALVGAFSVIVQLHPLSPAAGPARLANAAQVSDHDGGHDDCGGDHCSGEVISAKQTT